jgi:tetratricopeptide (TPR) repeat protein
LNSLAIAFQLDDRPEEAKATFAQSLALNRERGDRLNEAMVIGNMAGLLSAGGDLETAERFAKESIAISKEIGAISVLPTGQTTLAEICLRQGRDAEARTWVMAAAETFRSMGVPPFAIPLFYGILKIRRGDRPKGLAWVGFSRAHDPNKMELAAIIRSFWNVIRGDAPEEEVEAAMRAGEGLKLEEILAEAEGEE